MRREWRNPWDKGSRGALLVRGAIVSARGGAAAFPSGRVPARSERLASRGRASIVLARRNVIARLSGLVVNRAIFPELAAFDYLRACAALRMAKRRSRASPKVE